MIAVDLFAGAGGLGLGLERAGFSIVLANEIETDFSKTYALNHTKTRVLTGDIREIDFAAELSGLGVASVDIVAGGPPCQGFSTIGSKRVDDPRNALFHEFLRAVETIFPRYVVFENVAGFKSLYGGYAYQTLTNKLSLMGYGFVSTVLCASDFGLPQFRKRTILVGWKKDSPPIALPLPTHLQYPDLFGTLKKLCLWDAISDLPPIDAENPPTHYLSPPQTDYQILLRQGVSSLSEHCVANYGDKMKAVLERIPPGGCVKDLPFALRPKNCFKNTYARLLPFQPSPTITRNFGTPSSSRCIHPFQNRALSTREGARLQGFPDSYLFSGSKTSKNLQIGNAVPPVFGEIIARQIATKIGNPSAR